MKYVFKFAVVLGGLFGLFVLFGQVKTSQAQAGNWWGHYYDNPYLSGQAVVVRQDNFLKFDWGWSRPDPKLPEDFFSVRWVGSYHAKESGMYRIEVNADDGYRVYVDGKLMIDAWWRTPGSTAVSDIYLNKGGHSVKIEYHEETQAAYFDFKIFQKAEVEEAPEKMLQFVGQLRARGTIEKLPFAGFDALYYGQKTPNDLYLYWSDNPKEIVHGGYIYRDYVVQCVHGPATCEEGIEVVSAESPDSTPIARLDLGYIYDFGIEGNTLVAVETVRSRYASGLFSQAIHTVDVSNPANPYLIRTFQQDVNDRPLFKQEAAVTRTMGVHGNDVLVYWSDGSLDVFDFTNPRTPNKIGGNWVPVIQFGYAPFNSHKDTTSQEISVITHNGTEWVYVPMRDGEFAVYKFR